MPKQPSDPARSEASAIQSRAAHVMQQAQTMVANAEHIHEELKQAEKKLERLHNTGKAGAGRRQDSPRGAPKRKDGNEARNNCNWRLRRRRRSLFTPGCCPAARLFRCDLPRPAHFFRDAKLPSRPAGKTQQSAGGSCGGWGGNPPRPRSRGRSRLSPDPGARPDVSHSRAKAKPSPPFH